MTTAARHVGDVFRLTAAFTVGGTPTDPTGLTFTMREPDGVETIYVFGTDAQPVKDSTGNYHVDWAVAKPGRHHYRWVGTGAAAEAGQGEFYAQQKWTI